jgi:pre-mRNA cleavage complex 2 protein Pcf11
MADPTDLAEIAKDPTKSMNIDGKPRIIRHYGDTATIVLEDDRICELSFQSEPDPRRVLIDDSLVVYCPLNAVTFTEFKLNGAVHHIKIGSPSRELWIDGEWYDCYFNRKIKVKIGGGWHTVLLDGPLPSVKIGSVRPDLCRGRIYLLLDGKVDHKIPIYLDRKPQLVEVSGKPHVLRFVEGFRTLTINGHPFRTDFGGFPMVISVGGQKHYLRLTTLPPSVHLGVEPRLPSKPLSPKRESGTILFPITFVIRMATAQ